MAVYEDGTIDVPLARKAGILVNYAGAAVSLGLMVGVGVWGYQLIMRDVTGIPVVRAMEGAMRVAPDNPGGELAQHTGLSVNTVAAVGEAAAPEDRLVLAPVTTELEEEDLAAAPLAEAGEVSPAAEDDEALPQEVALTAPEAGEGPLQADDILALVDQISAGAPPMAPLEEGIDVAPTVLLDGEEVATTEALAEVSPVVDSGALAVASSLRPVARPRAVAADGTDAAVAAAVAQATAPAAEVMVTTADLPLGTNLVQLGAFPSPDVAAGEWQRLEGRFGDYMTGKTRVIQEAERNGTAFYRLRASGFADLSEARRFCAALEAGNADCIPVVVR